MTVTKVKSLGRINSMFCLILWKIKEKDRKEELKKENRTPCLILLMKIRT